MPNCFVPETGLVTLNGISIPSGAGDIAWIVALGGNAVSHLGCDSDLHFT